MPDPSKHVGGDRESDDGAMELADQSGDRSSPDAIKILAEASYQVARLIVPKLRDNGIPLTPANYRLWYEYYDGDSSELRLALDKLVEEKTPFTPDLTQSLYQRFFVAAEINEQSLVLDQAGRKAQSVLTEVMDELAKGAEKVSQYNQGLYENLRQVECALTLEEFSPVLNGIGQYAGDMSNLLDSMGVLMKQSVQRLTTLLKRLQEGDQLAHIDDLTGLYNRRALNFRLREEVSRSNRYGNPFSLIMLDIDDFKLINDSCGHLVGDRLLSVIGKTIAKWIRNSDFAARYGGEEFTVICPETEMESAAKLGDRLREVVQNMEFMVRGRQVKAGISGGVALYRKGETTDALIDRADRALYLAKHAGKNRIATEEKLVGPAEEAAAP